MSLGLLAMAFLALFLGAFVLLCRGLAAGVNKVAEMTERRASAGSLRLPEVQAITPAVPPRGDGDEPVVSAEPSPSNPSV
jgi:hypothetical protein